MATGLNTSLKPIFGIKTAQHESDNLEGFLTAVKNPPQGSFQTRTFWIPKQEDKWNLQISSKTEEIRMCLCSDRKDQLRESYKNWRLKTVGLWPPFNGGKTLYTPEGNSPVWGYKYITQQSENGTVSPRRTLCETIASYGINPISKTTR